MKRFLFLAIILISNFVFGADEANNIIEGSGYGKSSVTEAPNEEITPQIEQDYSDEIIHNFYIKSQSMNERKESIAKKAEMIKVLAIQSKDMSKPSNDKSKEKTQTVKGYCLIKDDVRISKQPSSLGIDCESNIGYISMFANLKAENKIATLFVDPVFIEYKGYRYGVKSSYVTNEAKTSYNVATYVNDRKLSEIALQTTSNAMDEIKTTSNQYLLAYEQSRYNQQTTVYSNGLNAIPLQSTQYLSPDPITYAAKAGINLLTSAVKGGVDLMKKDLPYLYEIKGGTKIYVDMQVLDQGEKVE